MARTSLKGKFTPRNPDKYIGNVNNITYRSSWELHFNNFLDNNPNIIKWASEEIAIPYISIDGKVHNYFPDYWIQYKNKAGELVQEIVEVKPDIQTRQPKTVGKNKRQQLYEQLTYAKNIKKWEAATAFCKKNGMKFRLVTENQLFK